MAQLWSSAPPPDLKPYVRAFAQRKLDLHDPLTVVTVPAQLEQVLNFEFGVMPQLHHRLCSVSSVIWLGGAQTSFAGTMALPPELETFAIFFQPLGFSQLFGIPAQAITNLLFDATLIIGATLRTLWNALGETASFEQRVVLAERFLREHLFRATATCRITNAAKQIFHCYGAPRISSVAAVHGLGLRQFEREFQRAIGTAPKTFARVARFQAALDAKLAASERSWLDIAHFFGYHDQMHMVHDFRSLSRFTPSHLIEQIGDVRPPALASA